ALMLEMPLLEPAEPAEAFGMVSEAFAVSEQFQTPVIMRETRSFSQHEGPVQVPDDPFRMRDRGLAREVERFVPVPKNVVAKHRALHARLARLQPWIEECKYNHSESNGPIGLLGAGFAFRKLRDALGATLPAEARLFKLGNLYPLPAERISRFMKECRDVVVFEENEPYVETALKAIAHDAGCRLRIIGKLTGNVSREGELFRWQIQQTLGQVLPGFSPMRRYEPETEASERPERENYCERCPFDEVIDALQDAARVLGQKPLLVGDPGCLARLAHRIDAKYALGSAVAVADGLSKSGVTERAVALFGDSSFFHSALPAICNAVCNSSSILMVVLDNGATVTTGFQPNPSVGRDALGRPAPRLDIERIARACGVERVRCLGPNCPPDALRAAFQEALAYEGLAMLIVRVVCDREA
ncbi:MAG TPA: thiamine pyrophosphate-dependent enzyme, partial [Isosphaeraceae bacterium]|nr:thiamine pyrophosphate-dependent enzyme [Isosphaeraceae bacterium]